MTKKLVSVGLFDYTGYDSDSKGNVLQVAAARRSSKVLPYILSADFPHQYDIEEKSRKGGATPLTLAAWPGNQGTWALVPGLRYLG